MRPIAIPPYVLLHNKPVEVLKEQIAVINGNIQRLYSADPEVSIIIPAYNEEKSILKTLSSLSASCTQKSVEIVVVNNNSRDATAELAAHSGAICITESKQGITPARNAGLQTARGKLILNADADTIYPPEWIDLMLAPLGDEQIAMVYGRFAFLPSLDTARLLYVVYEYISDLSRWINKKFREEAVNVYGFNSAFRRKEGLQVGGFDHPPGTNEDGWLGLKLRNAFKKDLYHLTSTRAVVWTTDRRIQIDGGLFKGFFKRIKRYFRKREG